MSTEPRWLIGGPQSAEQVQESRQEAEPEITRSSGTYQGKTADQWRAMAAKARGQSQASFERSDTDGALSQFASDSAARRYDMCATLAEQDGTWEFPALFTLTGALVPDAVWIKTKTKYGAKWVWRIGRGQAAQWFDPSKANSGARRRANDAAKGYQLGTIRATAYVGTSGSGKGLSGMLSVGFYIGRSDDGEIIEIVDNGSLGTQYKDW